MRLILRLLGMVGILGYIPDVQATYSEPSCWVSLGQLIRMYRVGDEKYPPPHILYPIAILNAWQDHPSILVLKKLGFSDVERQLLDHHEIWAALSALIEGRDGSAIADMGVFLRKAGKQHLQHLVSQLLKTAAQDSDVITQYVHSREFWKRGIPQRLEEIFVALLADSKTTIERDGHPVPLLSFRPQQIAMARILFQYGIWNSADSILEIGYGDHPSILTTLRAILPKDRTIVGLDMVSTRPPDVPEFAGITLFHGEEPDYQIVKTSIGRLAPYSAIFGLDVFGSKRPTPGIPLQPQVNHVSYLAWIHGLLGEGGLFISVNDRRHTLIFNPHEIGQAGLSVIRWNHPYILSLAERELFGFRLHLGHMNVYVFKKQTLLISRGGTRAQVI